MLESLTIPWSISRVSFVGTDERKIKMLLSSLLAIVSCNSISYLMQARAQAALLTASRCARVCFLPTFLSATIVDMNFP